MRYFVAVGLLAASPVVAFGLCVAVVGITIRVMWRIAVEVAVGSLSQ